MKDNHSSKKKDYEKEKMPHGKMSRHSEEKQQKKMGVDPELENLFSRGKSMRQEITKKLEVLHDKLGMNANEIKNYLENPENFDSKEWELLQRDREKLGQQLLLRTGIPNKKEKQAKEVIKEDANLSKSRKGKTLGSRRKWLPM